MKRIYIPLICLTIAFSACSTYKNSQTPDDVYYSPGGQREDGYNASSNNNSDYYSTNNDQYVRMRVNDPSRWSYFDDYNNDYYGGYSSMGMNPYYGSGLSFGIAPWIGFGYYSPFSYWNSYYTWNSFYNPYYGGIVVVNPKVGSSTSYTRLRTFNPASYTNNVYNRSNARSNVNSSNYSYSQTIRNNYNTTNNSYRPMNNRPVNNNFSQPVRTFSSPSFGGGGGGGGSRGGGGGGGISRPGR